MTGVHDSLLHGRTKDDVILGKQKLLCGISLRDSISVSVFRSLTRNGLY